MSLATVYSRARVGVEAPLVSVEVHLSNGLPGMSIVGLPETAVREARERVRGAIVNSGFEFPARRVTINLAPADLPKEGGRFDLPIALGILAASRQVPPERLRATEFLGELALSGELRPVSSVLPAALHAARADRALVLPRLTAPEAAVVPDAEIRSACHLLEVTAHLRGESVLPVTPPATRAPAADSGTDLAEVRGQPQARRALEVAAAGGHSLLMSGPPGTGKTLLASCLPGILPPMSEDEALEAAAIASVGGQDVAAGWGRRPFRAPHHTASAVALVGGGPDPRPGEISLAHHGALFLDELPEFDRRVLEVLREPLETGHIVISRAARQARFPARFQLVAAMNPCPCGYLGEPDGRCRCTPTQVQRYRQRISGPLLDRIDIQVEVPRITHRELQGPPGEASRAVRERVVAARQRQLERNGSLNARLDTRQLDRCCALARGDQALLEQAMDRLRLSARSYHRILKVARTIADLDGSERIRTPHLSEAIQYRRDAPA